MRPIDADDLKRYICETCEQHERCKDNETVCSEIADIDEQPTIDALQIVIDAIGQVEKGETAHWDINCDGFYPFCSNCKKTPRSHDLTQKNIRTFIDKIGEMPDPEQRKHFANGAVKWLGKVITELENIK